MIKRLLGAALVVCATLGFAQAEEYKAGQHYEVLPEKIPTNYRGSEAGEIMEIFSYGCIHCFNLEPFIQSWKQSKPDDIRFTPVPVVFNARQIPEVKAYYAAELLGIQDESHRATFNEVHINRNRLSSDEDFAEFYTRFGVSEDEYMKMANSFAVNVKVNQAQKVTEMSGVQGTPSLVVNGKYLVTGRTAGGNEKMFDVAVWLIRRDAAQ